METETATTPAANSVVQRQNPIALYDQSNYAAAASSSRIVLAANSDMNAYLRSFPPGFRFKPTDEELIVHYLLRKMHNKQPYPSRIHDADIYTESPFYFSENYAKANENEWYFLSPRQKKYEMGRRPNRVAGNGYWKATGADKTITSSKFKVDVGVVKTLVYYKGGHKNSVKTDWIMKEYRVKSSPPPQEIRVNSIGKSRLKKSAELSEKCMKLDDYVLYKIYDNSKDKKPNATNVKEGKANVLEEGEANDQDHQRFENFHDGVAQQVNIHQDHGPDENLVAGDYINQQNHASNIRQIDYSANQQQQQQQQLLWPIPNTNYLGYNSHVFPNDLSTMLMPQMSGYGFYDQSQTLYNQQTLSTDDYIPPQAMLPAYTCNNAQALNSVSNSSEEFSPAVSPLDASNDVQANNEMNSPQMQQQQYQNNEMNSSQMQQQQYQHRLVVMTRPSPSSTYHPYHHPDHPQN